MEWHDFNDRKLSLQLSHGEIYKIKDHLGRELKARFVIFDDGEFCFRFPVTGSEIQVAEVFARIKQEQE